MSLIAMKRYYHQSAGSSTDYIPPKIEKSDNPELFPFYFASEPFTAFCEYVCSLSLSEFKEFEKKRIMKQKAKHDLGYVLINGYTHEGINLLGELIKKGNYEVAEFIISTHIPMQKIKAQLDHPSLGAHGGDDRTSIKAYYDNNPINILINKMYAPIPDEMSATTYDEVPMEERILARKFFLNMIEKCNVRIREFILANLFVRASYNNDHEVCSVILISGLRKSIVQGVRPLKVTRYSEERNKCFPENDELIISCEDARVILDPSLHLLCKREQKLLQGVTAAMLLFFNSVRTRNPFVCWTFEDSVLGYFINDYSLQAEYWASIFFAKFDSLCDRFFRQEPVEYKGEGVSYPVEEIAVAKTEVPESLEKTFRELIPPALTFSSQTSGTVPATIRSPVSPVMLPK